MTQTNRRTASKTIGFFSLAIAVLAPTLASAEGQQNPMLAGLRQICLRLPEKDMMVRDMSLISARPLNVAAMCDCADSKAIAEPTLVKTLSMTKAEREALPNRRELSMFLAATYYSAALECYANAIRDVLSSANVGR